MRNILLFIILSSYCCEIDAQENIKWLHKNKEQLLETIMPIRPLNLEDYPTSFRWVVSIRIKGPNFDQLKAISLKKSYSGDIAAIVTELARNDLTNQIEQLMRINPNVSVSEAASSIKLAHRKLGSRECPAILKLAEEFEHLSVRTVLPDELFMNNTQYDITTQSLYGNYVQIRYYGPGPGAKIQKEPVLNWVERLRKLVGQQCK